MKTNKIIFVVKYQFFLRDYLRYGVGYMVKKGYDVEVWRVFDGASPTISVKDNMYEGELYHEYTYRKFKRKIKQNIDALFMLQYSKDYISYFVAKNGARYIIFDGFGALIQPPPEMLKNRLNEPKRRTIFHKVKTVLSLGVKGCVRRIRTYNERDLYLEARKKNPPILTVTSTENAASIYFDDEELKQNILYTHTWDYDRFIEIERENTCLNRRKQHIVFCDTGFFFPTYDTILSGDKWETVNHRDEILKKLYELFETVEKHYQLPVVIAGHPHTQYPDDAFGGRKIYINKTCELARNAVAYLMTSSTAVSFAALYDLPTLKIVDHYMKGMLSDGIGDYDMYNYIVFEAEVIGCGIIDLDNDEQLRNPILYIKKMDKEKREDYLRKYVIDNCSQDETIIEITEKYLKKINEL